MARERHQSQTLGLIDHNAGQREAAATQAQQIRQTEAQGFRRKLLAERMVWPIVALRQQRDKICRQELDSFHQE
jgi:glutamyl-tRNA reductase